MKHIIGRKNEVQLLEKILKSDRAEFLAIYGRRRVGKTFLIRNYFTSQKVYFFDVAGMKNSSIEVQISNFIDRVGEVFYGGLKLEKIQNWRDSLKTLTHAINQQSKKQKIVLFFDEFPWLATKKSGLLEAIDYFWNQYWSKDSRIKLIICGSAASWIIEKVINNKAGLHNRLTYSLLIAPFKLLDTKEYLKFAGFKLSNKQVIEYYMLTGGVAYYLTKLDKHLSVAQNIDLLAFQKNSFYINEFENLFNSLFDEASLFETIVRVIAENRYGIAQEKLFKLASLSKGGQAVKKLEALEATGFIKSFTPHFNSKKGIYYRVIDEFILFYLKWVEVVKDTLLTETISTGYWESKKSTQSYLSWSGYSFEALCYKHLDEIQSALQIKSAIPNSWRYISKEGNGAQIDLLFDRNDDAITLCEIKYNDHPFIIDKAYYNNLLNKAKIFKEHTRTKKQIFLAMITVSGIKKNIYSEEISAAISIDDIM